METGAGEGDADGDADADAELFGPNKIATVPAAARTSPVVIMTVATSPLRLASALSANPMSSHWFAALQ